MPFVDLPTNEPIKQIVWASKEVYPKWMFWKPRKTYLYVTAGNRIYEVDSHTLTLKGSMKSKVTYFTVQAKNHLFTIEDKA